MEVLLKRGVKRYFSGQVVELREILYFIWSSLSDSDKRNLGKEVYYDVLNGKYNNMISIHHVNRNNHAYYQII